MDRLRVYSNNGSSSNIDVLENGSNKKFSFEITPGEYQRLKHIKVFEKDLNKGFWGFVYKY